MAPISLSTPLMSLDGVVLDTETTGLNAATARVIQIGAIHFAASQLAAQRFETLVDPGVPIPPETTAVHGIRDTDVAGAGDFASVAEALATFVADRVVVGHTIGYDLTVLRREHALIGRPWRAPPALDVRMLARIAAPSLADYSLDRLCDWLGVTIRGRHTAIGDCVATAEVFFALLPALREKGVRTLAQAQAASRRLFEDEARASGALLGADPVTAQASAPMLRIDSFPYRHRIREVMSAPAATAEPETTVAEAVRILLERRISSLFVRGGDGQLGIVTERDVLRAIDSHGRDALERPLASLVVGPLQTVHVDAFVYRAIGRMTRLGFRHLGVRDDSGALVGAVTTRNLLAHRGTTAIVLGDEIDSAADAPALGVAWGKLGLMARSLVDEGVDPRTVCEVVSSELRAMTRRAARIAERRMAEAGLGPPPVPYALLVLGSGGRGESLLAPDQDNAIVYAHGEPGGPEDRWLETLATHVADILDEVGIPYCKGGVMGKNPAWRHSLAGWHQVIADWVRRRRPDDLLHIDIFFDGMPVHGDLALGESIRDHAIEHAADHPMFVNVLAELARRWTPPFTLLGRLRTGDDRLDLKLGGLMPLLSGARVLAVRHRMRERATPARLRAYAAAGKAASSDVEAIADAHQIILGTILRQQLADHETGLAPSNRVDIRKLERVERDALKTALRKIETLIDLVGEGRL
ncbi:MAG: CBS domain-containing protein [Ectothiorhodospiraceae bacterium]|nr:CBS domain-containing protein [Ectothiorhodospiraceae bacterium]